MTARGPSEVALLALGYVAAVAITAGIICWLVPPSDLVAAAELVDPDAATPAPDGTTVDVTFAPSTRPTTTSTSTTTIPPEPRRATLAFTGDLIPHQPVVRTAAALSAGGWDFRPMFQEVAPILSGADLAICHLETPLSVDAPSRSRFPRFDAPRALAEAVRDTGYDGCSTASNHAFDQGAAGVAETLQVMEETGLAQAGMANSGIEDIAPVFYDANGITVAHISATYGLNGFAMPADRSYLVDLIDPDDIIAEAALARESGAELVVLSLHWGSQYRADPNDAQLAWLAELLPDDEIDLVVGHHAHVVQPVDKLADEWVVFGLGNFLSNQTASCCGVASQDGMIATVQLLETSPGAIEVTGVTYTPTWVDRGAGYVIRVAGDRSDDDLPASTIEALASSYERTVAVVGSRLGADDGLTVAAG
jgi:poly-gamma-glutamate synthesis protein (capsule biosynthesis protein)